MSVTTAGMFRPGHMGVTRSGASDLETGFDAASSSSGEGMILSQGRRKKHHPDTLSLFLRCTQDLESFFSTFF